MLMVNILILSMGIDMNDKINTKDMVDAITAVLDRYALLDSLTEKKLQCLCEDLKDAMDDFIGEEE